jgi:hypothetical protein
MAAYRRAHSHRKRLKVEAPVAQGVVVVRIGPLVIGAAHGDFGKEDGQLTRRRPGQRIPVR